MKRKTALAITMSLVAILVLLVYQGVLGKGMSADDCATSTRPAADPDRTKLGFRPDWGQPTNFNVVVERHVPKGLRGAPSASRSGVTALPTTCGIALDNVFVTNAIFAPIHRSITSIVGRADAILRDRRYVFLNINGLPLIRFLDVPNRVYWELTVLNGRVCSLSYDQYEDDGFALLNASQSCTLSWNNNDGVMLEFRSRDGLNNVLVRHCKWPSPPYDISWAVRVDAEHILERRYTMAGVLVGESRERIGRTILDAMRP